MSIILIYLRVAVGVVPGGAGPGVYISISIYACIYIHPSIYLYAIYVYTYLPACRRWRSTRGRRPGWRRRRGQGPLPHRGTAVGGGVRVGVILAQVKRGRIYAFAVITPAGAVCPAGIAGRFENTGGGAAVSAAAVYSCLQPAFAGATAVGGVAFLSQLGVDDAYGINRIQNEIRRVL